MTSPSSSSSNGPENEECSIACAYCHAAMGYAEGPQLCAHCYFTNIVFLSSADACEAIATLRSQRSVLIAPTRYVPGLGWVVAYFRSMRKRVA